MKLFVMAALIAAVRVYDDEAAPAAPAAEAKPEEAPAADPKPAAPTAGKVDAEVKDVVE